jgi:hypothetical protein
MTMNEAALWKWFPVGLLGATVIFAVWRVALVVNDPSFAADEQAYAHGQAWDAELARRAASAELGWSVTLEAPPASATGEGEILLRVSDAGGRPVEGLAGNLIAFHNARAGAPRSSDFVAGGEPGLYRTSLQVDRAGLWQWEVNLNGASGAWHGFLREEVARP